MEIVVQNRQRSHTVDAGEIERFLWELVERKPPEDAGDLTVRIVSDRGMREFNRLYRGRNSTTDVLAFPAGGEAQPDGSRYLGDIVISADRAAVQAAERGHRLSREVRILALHGYLHLMGHDHETDDGTMLRLQRRLERELIR